MKTVGLGANDVGIVLETVDWMGITVYNLIPWQHADMVVVLIDDFRAKREATK